MEYARACNPYWYFPEKYAKIKAEHIRKENLEE